MQNLRPNTGVKLPFNRPRVQSGNSRHEQDAYTTHNQDLNSNRKVIIDIGDPSRKNSSKFSEIDQYLGLEPSIVVQGREYFPGSNQQI